MKNELKIKKCNHCGALVKVFDECNCACGIECCGEKMKTLEPNSTDAAVEKHVPCYEKDGDQIIVKVNHVMEEEHYIEWISLVIDHEEWTLRLLPGQPAEARFPYVPGSTIYEYCNKHGLWKKDVE